MNQKTDLREEIERLLQAHSSGLTSAQLAERTGGDPELIKSILGRLKRSHAAKAVKPGSPNTKYIAITVDYSTSNPNRINVMSGHYIPERDNPSMPSRPGSDQHEQYGSRIGNQIFYRDGTVKQT
jgi:hypothetical protein